MPAFGNAGATRVPDLAAGKNTCHGTEKWVPVGNVERPSGAHHGVKLGVG